MRVDIISEPPSWSPGPCPSLEVLTIDWIVIRISALALLGRDKPIPRIRPPWRGSVLLKMYYSIKNGPAGLDILRKRVLCFFVVHSSLALIPVGL